MYDIIIIGAGTAGIAAYQEAIKHTQTILIVNDGPWDTTCARVGCMPSKVLISSANRMHDILHADQVALNVEAKIDTSTVMKHVQQLRDQFTSATLKQINKWPDHHKVSGKASFINANTIEVNGTTYTAKSFILAVGSTPTMTHDWQSAIGDKLISSDQIFELSILPQSMAVIGSGVIALELAQALHRLGVEITIFARSKKVGILTSPQLQQLAQDTLAAELNLKFETLPKKVANEDNNVKISYLYNEQIHSLTVDYVLQATGRRSNLSSLQLQKLNENYQDIKNIPIDPKTKQLGKFPIFVCGDAHTDTPLQHEAAHEGRQAVHNCLAYPKIKNIKTLTPLGIVFSAPEMAIVGLSHKQLIAQKSNFVTGYVSYEKQGRAKVLSKNQGAIEIYIDTRSHKILGAELFVHQAEHLAHLLAWMIAEDVNIHHVLDKPYYHPTLEEGLRTALKHARRQLDSN